MNATTRPSTSTPDEHPGLGDMVAAALEKVGVTKGRVRAVVGDCGCQKRQEKLNRWGRWLGLG
jgi:hypothetical protein